MVKTRAIVLTFFMKTVFFILCTLFASVDINNASIFILAIIILVFCSAVYDTTLVIYLKRFDQLGYRLKLSDAFKVNMLIFIIVVLFLLLIFLTKEPSGYGSLSSLLGMIFVAGFSAPLTITTPIIFGIAILIEKFKRPISEEESLRQHESM